VEVDGTGSSIHRLPYLKMNCSGAFEVANNSFACARLVAWESDDAREELRTDSGAVIEMVGGA